MIVIRRVGVLSLGVMSGILSAIGGLIAGLLMAGFFSIISAFSGAAGDIYDMDGLGFMGWMFSGMVIFIYPILYGVAGFLSGVIGGALYNLFAGWVGGIKVELKQEVAIEESTS